MTDGPAQPPLIVACLAPVAGRAHVDPLRGTVVHDDDTGVLSQAEGAALEHALRVAEMWSGRVVVLALGPPSIEAVLADVAALGVSVFRIDGPERDGVDAVRSLAVDQRREAAALADAARRLGQVSLVLCGDRSEYRSTGELPAFLAHELGAAQALGLVGLDVTPTGLVGLRRLDGGWRERLAIPTPAVCSVEGAGVRLRRASMPGVLDASGRLVPVVPGATGARSGAAVKGAQVTVGTPRPLRVRPRVLPPPESKDANRRIAELTGVLDSHDPPVVVGPTGPTEAADALFAFLSRHGIIPDMTGGSDG